MSIKSELIKLADKLDFNKKFAQANEVDEMLKDLDEDGLDSNLDPDDLSYEDDLRESEYDTHDRGLDSPEGLLLTRLDIASKLEADFPGKSPEEISEELGLAGNEEVVSLIRKLMESGSFYKSP